MDRLRDYPQQKACVQHDIGDQDQPLAPTRLFPRHGGKHPVRNADDHLGNPANHKEVEIARCEDLSAGWDQSDMSQRLQEAHQQ